MIMLHELNNFAKNFGFHVRNKRLRIFSRIFPKAIYLFFDKLRILNNAVFYRELLVVL